MEKIDDPALVRREYRSLDRVARRRLDVTGWIRGVDAFDAFLRALAEVKPRRVLDAGSGRRGPYPFVARRHNCVLVADRDT